ncbi:multiple epidermal growth factor-like domains protein 11 [Branchiostoma floridae]|uniref:Multiple epidermal growth factor-like domains protein 11 n=1 Tax=Branchiostoma floridae TaxID=7739 RepID=A0A9J7KVS9_BRAFL|nr:multiple epidermal growth factor-like domains protein 11 [Branchiostoma floridae]XP_035671111.1 multiple epidermal growth factor-like domains protein 11 [Branchiostoma floridae]
MACGLQEIHVFDVFTHDPQESGNVLELVILNNGERRCSFSYDMDLNHMSHFWRKQKYTLLGSFIFQSSKTQQFVCELPQDGLPVRVSLGDNELNEILLNHLELEIKPVGCPPNKYGLTCDRNCTCENGAQCHALNGACKCPPGWQGVVCDIPHSTVVITATPSDSRHIYINGSLTLHCLSFHVDVEKMIWAFPNGTKKWLRKTQEDQIKIENLQSQHNGTYTCTVVTEDGAVINTSYELHAVACPPGNMGELCEDVCDCPHGVSCDRWSGCVCPSGWTGTVCQTPCPVDTYGLGCRNECHCHNGAVCDSTDGRCNCTYGWYGTNCNKPCPPGLYGWRCRHVCGCKNNAICHHVDGSCKCVSPWTGRWCDVIQTDTFPLLLQLLIPLLLLALLVSVAILMFYKWKRASRARQDEDLDETQALLELSSMEEDLAQSLQPGWLNRWERSADNLTLDELIGLGTFAHVRKGQLRTAGIDTTVAVKSVRTEDRSCYRAFCREAAILIAVHEQSGTGAPCPSNIIKFLGVITKSRPKCIILEYASKRDLLTLLRQRPDRNGGLPLGSLLRNMPSR